MPTYYTFDFYKVNSEEDVKSQQYYYPQLSSLIHNPIPLAVIFLLVLSSLVKKEDTDSTKIVYLSAALLFIFLMQRFIPKDPYLVKTFRQAYIKFRDRQIIVDGYHFLNDNYREILDDFKRIKNINSLDQFVDYYQGKSEDGLCTGYTYALMKEIAIHPHSKPDVWFNEIQTTDIIRNQLIEHVAKVVKNNFSEENTIHFCDKKSIHLKVNKLLRELFHIPNITAANSLYGRMNKEELFNAQDNILTAFDRHFRSLGYVSPDKMEFYGNRPMNDIDDESLMTVSELQEFKTQSEESQESSVPTVSVSSAMINRFFKRMKMKEILNQRKTEYINENSEDINLDKFTLAGEISIHSKELGHSMLCKVSKDHIDFFDSNYGLYRYPSSKIFCQNLKKHIQEKYSDTETLSLRTFIFKI